MKQTLPRIMIALIQDYILIEKAQTETTPGRIAHHQASPTEHGDWIMDDPVVNVTKFPHKKGPYWQDTCM